MIVRKAGIQDVIGVYNLMNELEETVYDFDSFKEFYSGNLACDMIHYIIVEDHSEIIGYASLHIQNLLHHLSSISEIQEIIVASGHRGRGVGKMLIDELKKVAREEGCSQLEVCCNRRRIRSHEFYINNGLKKTHFKFTALL